MPAMIVEIKNTSDADWFFVIDNGLATVPLLGRNRAAGMVRHLTDGRILKAFFLAKDAWEAAEQSRTNLAVSLADLEKFFDRETWNRLLAYVESPASEAIVADDVTKDFHSDPDPQIFVLDEVSDAYLLLPPVDQDMGAALVVVGRDAVYDEISKLKSGPGYIGSSAR